MPIVCIYIYIYIYRVTGSTGICAHTTSMESDCRQNVYYRTREVSFSHVMCLCYCIHIYKYVSVSVCNIMLFVNDDDDDDVRKPLRMVFQEQTSHLFHWGVYVRLIRYYTHTHSYDQYTYIILNATQPTKKFHSRAFIRYLKNKKQIIDGSMVYNDGHFKTLSFSIVVLRYTCSAWFLYVWR
jgi:hypothetical protein